MKIRQGFVSNSSSSSFCIIGVKLEEDPIDILKKLLNITNEDIFAKMAEDKTTETIDHYCECWLEEALEEKNIDIHHVGYDGDGGRVIGEYVGSWEYDSIEMPAQEEFDKAKEIVKNAGLSIENMKIFCSFSG